MPTVILIEHDGTEHHVEADAGNSVMQTAIGAMVPGILADCGGNCSCATCHGYVDPAWVGRLTPPAQEEIDMLEGVLDPRENSRLTCQIKISDALDGLVVRLPESQV